jgi:glycosyltransferase involved in cell wall biosynthesis
MIFISAIICTYNREKLILRTLHGLEDQSINSGLYEIIIINNNSTDSTEVTCKQFIEQHPQINCLYFSEKNQGLSYSRNRGIKESSGKYITFLDDDSIPEPDFLKVIVDYLENHSDIMAAGGRIHLQYEGEQPGWVNRYLAPLLGYFEMGNKIKPFNRKSYPRGSNMTFRKDIFSETGDFNTELGRKGSSLAGGEEKDLFNRVYRQNHRVIYLPQALVYHLVPLERTKKSYVKQQAEGIGKSERVRTKNNGQFAYLGRILHECIKWIVSIVLFLIYLVTFQFQKAKMILLVRYYISKGLIQVKFPG